MKTQGSCQFNSSKKGGQTLSYPHEYDEKSGSKQSLRK